MGTCIYDFENDKYVKGKLNLKCYNEGCLEGKFVGECIGWKDGKAEGFLVGWKAGWFVGFRDGCLLGRFIGCRVGWMDGAFCGCLDGFLKGWKDGWLEGQELARTDTFNLYIVSGNILIINTTKYASKKDIYTFTESSLTIIIIKV